MIRTKKRQILVPDMLWRLLAKFLMSLLTPLFLRNRLQKAILGKYHDIFKLKLKQSIGLSFLFILYFRCVSKSRKNLDKIALVLDNYLHMFSHDLQEVFSVEFKVTIDVLEWTNHPQFLLLGLSNGQAQLVHVPSQIPLPPIQVSEAGFKDLQNWTFLTKNDASPCLLDLEVGDLDQLDQALKVNDLAVLKLNV